MQSAATLPTSPPLPGLAHPNEPVWRRALDCFERANALAAREVRLALRSPRAWLLLSLYVSILGAIVLAQFPADTAVEVWAPATSSQYSNYSSGVAASQRGQELLGAFTWAQFFGVWLLVPSLAVGALHQEREGQTLESLLLSPLSPLQIVWGKLCGVLAMAFVLLLGTLPLTSLCFLLGGVSPEEVALRFFGLLAWAMFAAGVGLYCAARTPNATKATVEAYGLSLVGLCVAGVMLGPGVALASIGLLVWVGRHFASLVRAAIKRASGSDSRGAQTVANWVAIIAAFALLIFVPIYVIPMQLSWIVITALLVFPYGVYVSQLAVNAAAHELAKRSDPAPPKREAWKEISQAWQGPVAPESVVYTRGSDGSISYYSSAPHASGAVRTAPGGEAPPKPTYGIKGFLSDKWNPIFARDLRHGVGGRASTLVRWAYCAVIATQLFLIWMLSGPSIGREETSFLQNCVKLQVVLIMMACAWLGSRTIAPEREQQTLQQLLTLPMPASGVIGGKIASVLYFSLYVLLTGLPLLMMLPLGLVLTWGSALGIAAMQGAWGLLAGSWGVFCSLHCGTTRRALVWSMGGVGLGIFGAILTHGVWDLAAANGWGAVAEGEPVQWITHVMSPLGLVEAAFTSGLRSFTTFNPYSYSRLNEVPWGALFFSVLCASALAALLFTSSARAFAKLAHEG